jgi:hypothetical protein
VSPFVAAEKESDCLYGVKVSEIQTSLYRLDEGYLLFGEVARLRGDEETENDREAAGNGFGETIGLDCPNGRS